MSDARFEDAGIADRPLRLLARTADDLAVISALVQDAVARPGDLHWMPRRRRLVVIMNRFRWEDRDAAAAEGRPFERVRAALVADCVHAVRGRGVDPDQREAPLAILSLAFDGSADAGGRLTLLLAGGGEIAADVEALEVRLTDLTRPWPARAGRAPAHDLEG